ncbi:MULTISPECIES: nitroreductase family protein [unclassified Microbacterium]|uniref:nitroreductase family protein n=1 Tax=unclassified Microbacterium TaxID=2609290 RepID=UPI00365C92D6
MSALEAVSRRQSWSKVTPEAPTREQLLPLIAAAGRVADHSSLRPWRLIELRGEDRERLGAAIAEETGDSSPSTKPLRASLLIAVVASYRRSDKVPRWEQEAVASGVAHVLSLLLDEAGWGVIWRTGGYTRTPAVARAHGLGPDEELLGWLYVGGKPGKEPGRRRALDADAVLSRMPARSTPEEATTSPDSRTPETRTKTGECASKKARKKAKKKAKKAAKKAREKAAKQQRRLRKAAKKD